MDHLLTMLAGVTLTREIGGGGGGKAVHVSRLFPCHPACRGQRMEVSREHLAGRPSKWTNGEPDKLSQPVSVMLKLF